MSKVTEFVELVGELRSALGTEYGESCPPWEVIGPWASTIFINSNKPVHPPPPMQQAPGGEKTVSGLLEEKKVEAKKNAEGKAYKVYSFKVDGQWYNTFDAKAFGGVTFTEGDEVELSLKAGKNPKYFNIVAAKKLGEAAAEEDCPW
jgi:hypothetical protein